MTLQKLMIEYDPELKAWVNKTPDISRDGRVGHSRLKGSPETVNDFLAYVVAGSEYQLEDVVAIGIETNHAYQGDKLHVICLSERGMEEATNPGALQEPYNRLREALIRSEDEYSLEGNLEIVAPLIGSDKTRTLIDWGGPDGKKRVLAIYSEDVTSTTFGL